MNEPPKLPKPFEITKDSLISFGVAIFIGGGCFTAGTLWEKINRLDGIGIERRLVRMEAKLELVAKRLGIAPEVLATTKAEEVEPSRSNTTAPLLRARQE